MTNTEPLFGKPPDNANGKIIGTAINGETSTAPPREPHIKIGAAKNMVLKARTADDFQSFFRIRGLQV